MTEERERRIEKAHEMFDRRNLLLELKWQRNFFKIGYVSKEEELFNLWIFDSVIKMIEKLESMKDELAEYKANQEKILESVTDEADVMKYIKSVNACNYILGIVNKYCDNEKEEEAHGN